MSLKRYDYNGGGEIKRENRGSSRSGRFQAAGEVFKKVGGEPPHLFKGLPGRPEPQTFWHPGFPFLIWSPSLVSGTPFLSPWGPTNGGSQIKRKNVGSSGSGRFRAAGELFKKVGGEPPTFLKGFPAARSPRPFGIQDFPS